MARANHLAGLLGMLVLLNLAGPGRAQPIAHEGLVFSDELGGFRILQVTGSGTRADPFVVVEEVTDGEGSTLIIRGLSAGFGNRVGTTHLVGFSLRKVVINRTADSWGSYEVELREALETHSPYEDGLSFGQGSQEGRPFRSSRYAGSLETDEPFDSVMFTDGTVGSGEGVVLQLVITDTSPLPLFYVVQRQVQQVAWLQSLLGRARGLAALRARGYVPSGSAVSGEGSRG